MTMTHAHRVRTRSMLRLPSLTPRQVLIVLHDLAATAAAIVLTFFIRFEDTTLRYQAGRPQISADLSGLRRRRFISSSACIATSGASRRCPTSTISSAPPRCSRCRCSRSITFCWRRTSTARSSSARSPSCSTGSCRCFFSAARASPIAISTTRARCSASRSPTRRRRWCSAAPPTPKCCCARSKAARCKKIWPVGILSPSPADRGQSIRGIPVLGDIDDLERVVADLANRGTRVTRLVLAPSALSPEARPEVDPDPRAPARPDHEPVAVARRRRRRRCSSRRSRSRICCCGPSVKIDYRAARAVRQRQVDRRHRRRRLDRRGNLRSHRHLRRRAAAGDREFRAGAARGAGDARRQAKRGRDHPAASPISATASASSA